MANPKTEPQHPDQHLQHWQVGDIRITRVTELVTSSLWKYVLPDVTPEQLQGMPWLGPALDADGNLLMSIHAFVLRTPEQTLVVDTCIGNDKDRHYKRWHRLQTDFLGRLASAGVDRLQVDQVMCTHLHVDHVGWNTMLDPASTDTSRRWLPTFPNARYLFADIEWQHWRSEPQPYGPVVDDSVQPILDAGLADLVAGDHEVCPGVVFQPTPGHTPGHVSIRISSRGEQALITGDTFHHPCQVGCPHWSSSADWDPLQAASTRQALLDACADQPVLVLGSHFVAPTGGRVVRDGSSWRLDW